MIKIPERVNILEKDMKKIKKRLSLLESNIIKELLTISDRMLSIKRWIISVSILILILFISIVGRT